jgi:hypothetical protein
MIRLTVCWIVFELEGRNERTVIISILFLLLLLLLSDDRCDTERHRSRCGYQHAQRRRIASESTWCRHFSQELERAVSKLLFGTPNNDLAVRHDQCIPVLKTDRIERLVDWQRVVN